MYALIDCNNFYASCERVFRPDLEGKPICVLSNNDGCVIARSNEAKVAGIPMGAPAFEYRKLFEQHKIHVFSANFALYGDMSNRVMTILSEYSPEVEIYSIDELFLNLTGFEHYHLLEYGEQMRKRVLKATGIPISIGIAPTKSLAKVANRIAKKYPQLCSVYSIDSEEKRVKALKWLPIQDVWGIGSQHAKRLQTQHVKTAYDFTLINDSWVRKNLAIVGLRLQNDLQGIPTIQMEDVKTKKNIATTRSFEKNYTELDDLKERICSFAVSCAEKLRKQKSECRSLMVFIHTNRFRNNLPQYNMSTVIKIPFSTSSSIEIAKYAILGLERIFKEGYHYKKAGVIIQEFTPNNQKQLALFENSDKRHIDLMKTIDTLNQLFGQQKIKLARQDQKRLWKMKQEKLSPCYTTRISEIISIKS